jgi:hypothetical protein
LGRPFPSSRRNASVNPKPPVGPFAPTPRVRLAAALLLRYSAYPPRYIIYAPFSPPSLTCEAYIKLLLVSPVHLRCLLCHLRTPVATTSVKSFIPAAMKRRNQQILRRRPTKLPIKGRLAPRTTTRMRAPPVIPQPSLWSVRQLLYSRGGLAEQADVPPPRRQQHWCRPPGTNQPRVAPA